MDYYQQFIAKSRYSRFMPDKNRREHWEESVDRYFNFMFNHLDEKYKFSPDAELRTELVNAVKNLDVMPSMRAIMTAGKALDRDNHGMDAMRYAVCAAEGIGISQPYLGVIDTWD